MDRNYLHHRDSHMPATQRCLCTGPIIRGCFFDFPGEMVRIPLSKMMTGVNMVHVPDRGTAPAITDLLGGQSLHVAGNRVSGHSLTRNSDIENWSIRDSPPNLRPCVRDS
jgi:hypothetical protein